MTATAATPTSGQGLDQNKSWPDSMAVTFAQLPRRARTLSGSRLVLAYAIAVRAALTSTKQVDYRIPYEPRIWAELAGCSARSISRLVDDLEGFGVLRVGRSRGGHREWVELDLGNGFARVPVISPADLAAVDGLRSVQIGIKIIVALAEQGYCAKPQRVVLAALASSAGVGDPSNVGRALAALADSDLGVVEYERSTTPGRGHHGTASLHFPKVKREPLNRYAAAARSARSDCGKDERREAPDQGVAQETAHGCHPSGRSAPYTRARIPSHPRPQNPQADQNAAAPSSQEGGGKRRGFVAELMLALRQQTGGLVIAEAIDRSRRRVDARLKNPEAHDIGPTKLAALLIGDFAVRPFPKHCTSPAGLVAHRISSIIESENNLLDLSDDLNKPTEWADTTTSDDLDDIAADCTPIAPFSQPSPPSDLQRVVDLLTSSLSAAEPEPNRPVAQPPTQGQRSGNLAANAKDRQRRRDNGELL